MERRRIHSEREKVWDSRGGNGKRKDKFHFPEILKTEEVILISMYIGRRSSRVRITKIPPEVDTTWLVAAMTVDMEEKITFLHTTATDKQNWQGQTLYTLITLITGRNFRNY